MSTVRVLFLCALTAAGSVLAPQASAHDDFHWHEVTLQSWLDLPAFGPGARAGSSCWGYTSPEGREYALMGLSDMTAFVEITDPVNPVIVDSYVHPDSAWCEMKTYGRYAYVSNETGGGLQVFDMGKIDEGMVAHVLDVQLRGLSTSHTVTVNAESGHLYLNGSNIDGGGLTILSLANPANPEWVGAYTGTYVHDSQVVTYSEGPYAGREIAFCYAGYNGVHIVDVTDKANPVVLSRTGYPGLSYCHQGWLSADRKYIYVDDELDEVNLGWPTLTRVFDVSDLANPKLVSTFGNGVPCIDHNQFVRDRFLFQSNYTSGLRVWDLLNPTAPTEVAWFDTYPDDDNIILHDGLETFNGTWNNYPYFASGNVVVSDIDRGMFVLRPTPFTLTVSPLQAGERATLRIDHATPKGRVYFALSMTGPGDTFVPRLGVTLGLDAPRLIGSALADGTGVASVVGVLPPNLEPRVLWIQAAEAGRTSTVVLTQIN